MITQDENNAKKGFTAAEQKILSGLSNKVAKKHQCSSTYILHIIKGRRGTKTEKAKNIVKDLNALLEVLRPET